MYSGTICVRSELMLSVCVYACVCVCTHVCVPVLLFPQPLDLILLLVVR